MSFFCFNWNICLKISEVLMENLLELLEKIVSVNRYFLKKKACFKFDNDSLSYYIQICRKD